MRVVSTVDAGYGKLMTDDVEWIRVSTVFGGIVDVD